MQKRNKQLGMGLWGVLIVLALIAFFATLVIRLYPVYYEYFSITSIMSRISKEQLNSKSEIVQRLSKTMQIDNVSRIDLDDFDIKQTRAGYTVTLDYEDRVHIFGNVDAIASFNKVIEISRP